MKTVYPLQTKFAGGIIKANLDLEDTLNLAISSELSETQNYAYRYVRFFPGTHDFC